MARAPSDVPRRAPEGCLVVLPKSRWRRPSCSSSRYLSDRGSTGRDVVEPDGYAGSVVLAGLARTASCTSPTTTSGPATQNRFASGSGDGAENWATTITTSGARRAAPRSPGPGNGQEAQPRRGQRFAYSGPSKNRMSTMRRPLRGRGSSLFDRFSRSSRCSAPDRVRHVCDRRDARSQRRIPDPRPPASLGRAARPGPGVAGDAAPSG